MEYFLRVLITGLSIGAVYGLLALGFVIIFKATEVFNFANGSLVMVGAYLIFRFGREAEMPFWLAFVLAIAATGLLALVLQVVLVRSSAARSLLAASILTLGLNIILETEIVRRIGTRGILPVPDPWGNSTIDILGIRLAQARVAAIVAAVVVLGLFFAWFKLSNWGIAMRAAAEDPATAMLMGIRLNRIGAVAWLVAGALGAVGAVFLTASPAAGLEAATGAIALRALPAAILGGLDSPGGAVVGGLVIGVAESLTQGYSSDLSFLGEGFHDVMPYVVMLAVLVIRPSGLFGTREVARV